ncbi:magnesium transporter MRS2-2 isoform X4 [Jatropha curcas]|uniref:magnesium transporter MRS2-2 isoform X4 n=1 Tax=Jatropha curcas TaxID=180498 RepID=UPI0005FB4487|nr:magnesium transporter MRS2-2 isoform X4 [Jatropha curcas]
MGRGVILAPVETQASLKKKTAVSTSWILLDQSGQGAIIDVDKYAIMRRVQIHARDLRILDPLLSYPSTILGRERVIVLNLEHIKAIITAEEVLLRDPLDDNVIPIVEELQRRLPLLDITSQIQGEEEEHQGVGKDVDTGEENEFPFEFRALEVALEAICSFLDARTRELETEAYPALDELTSKISSRNLDRVRKLKSSMTRLTNRVQKIRDELEQLLDDDDDMADLYLSRKLVGSASPVSGSSVPNWFLSSPTIGSKISRTSRASAITIPGENDVEDLEMLLEAYFMQIDGTLNKLTTVGYCSSFGRIFLFFCVNILMTQRTTSISSLIIIGINSFS